MDSKNVKKFVRFYDTGFNAIYRYCLVKTSDDELAKDLAQQAFLKTWVYVQTKQEALNIKSLVYKIAQNLIIDWYRKKKDVSLDALMEQGFDVAGENTAKDAARYHSTAKILEEIDESDKELIILRYVNGLKPKEIAEMQDENVNVISVRIHRAKKRLQTIIKTKGYELF